MKRFRLLVLGGLAWLAYGLVHKSIRCVMGPDSEEVYARLDGGLPVIFAFWHADLSMLFSPYRGRGLCCLVSRSDDGEIITRAAESFGLKTVRGSASRGGLSSALALIDVFRAGFDLAIACDGPKGPRHVAKEGIVMLGRLCGAPIFPIAVAPERPIVFARSWDRFTVPLPFSRVHYAVGAAVHVPKDADEDRSAAYLAEIQRSLEELRLEAIRRAGSPPALLAADEPRMPRI